jgi:hypothetical protein
MQTKTPPTPARKSPAPEQPRPRFIETAEPRRVPPSSTHAAEEAKLADEIEKLRRQG